MKLYNLKLELDFESDLTLEELEELIQVCLVVQDENETISTIHLDNVSSNKFSIRDYTDQKLKQICLECNGEVEYRMIDLDGTNLEERLVCINNNEHYIWVIK